MYVESADIFVTPYPNLEQIVSGTLSYAMGAGKPIVSTSWEYARERLADGRGLLVSPGSTSAQAQGLVELARDPQVRGKLGRLAYAHSRGMLWSETGAASIRDDLGVSISSNAKLSKTSMSSGSVTASVETWPGNSRSWFARRAVRRHHAAPTRTRLLIARRWSIAS